MRGMDLMIKNYMIIRTMTTSYNFSNTTYYYCAPKNCVVIALTSPSNLVEFFYYYIESP